MASVATVVAIAVVDGVVAFAVAVSAVVSIATVDGVGCYSCCYSC